MSDVILSIAIKCLTKEFDEFISCCIDEHGKPKAPNMGELMKAKGSIPSVGYNNGFVKKDKKSKKTK